MGGGQSKKKEEITEFLGMVTVYENMKTKPNDTGAQTKWTAFKEKNKSSVGKLRSFEGNIKTIEESRDAAIKADDFRKLSETLQKGIKGTYKYIIDQMNAIYDYIFWMLVIADKMSTIVKTVSETSRNAMQKLEDGIAFLEKTENLGTLEPKQKDDVKLLVNSLTSLQKSSDEIAAFAPTKGSTTAQPASVPNDEAPRVLTPGIHDAFNAQIAATLQPRAPEGRVAPLGAQLNERIAGLQRSYSLPPPRGDQGGVGKKSSALKAKTKKKKV
jgi:hypothetical protein